MADVADLRLDLTQPGFYLRPDYFDVLADLREQAPVYRTLDGSWAVTRYDDIRSISRDPDRFVSGRGVLINDPMRSDGSGGLSTFSILHLDPPVHAALPEDRQPSVHPQGGRPPRGDDPPNGHRGPGRRRPDEPVDGGGRPRLGGSHRGDRRAVRRG